jgi:glutamyl/glutaminyl-tRNA synthetase
MAQSMLILEQELKSRSAGLKSSRAVTRFVEEITSTVTAFIDNQQANHVVKEYLKDEKGLKRTEQLLRNIMQRQPGSSSIPRIEKLLMEKGLSEKDLEKLVDRLLPDQKVPTTPKKKRKTRKPRAPRPVVEKIEKALTDKLDTIKGKEETAAYLSGLFQREVGVRLKEVKADRVRLAADLKRVDDMLSATGLGLVALDKDGKVIMMTSAAASILGEGEDTSLPPALLEFIASGQEDLFAGRGEFLNRQPSEERDRLLHILEAIDHPILSEEGELLGLILKGN